MLSCLNTESVYIHFTIKCKYHMKLLFNYVGLLLFWFKSKISDVLAKTQFFNQQINNTIE